VYTGNDRTDGRVCLGRGTRVTHGVSAVLEFANTCIY
jgi:hypothetical protein